MKVTILTVKEIVNSLWRHESKPSEWAELSLVSIRGMDKQVGAFLSFDEDRVMEHARQLDDAKPNGRMFGVPYALKDNMCTAGLKTTAGSRILETYIPPYSSTVHQRLLDTRAVLVGKTNLDEFAMGSSTENSAYQLTRNPYNLEAVPGGSSGGSAAAVAARMVPFALGSDTGGSIRQPAAFCGVVGLKPTYGRVSRYGLIAFASSLDQIGPFTQTVEDAAYVLQAISGHDPLDSTSSPADVDDYITHIGDDVRGLRIGMVRDMSTEGLHPGVQDAVNKAVEVLEKAGAQVVEVSLPHSQYAVATYYLVAPAEASSNLSRYDGVRYGRRVAGETLIDMYERTRSEGFGMEVKRRIMIGTYALSSGYYDAYYLRAQQMRTLIRQDYQAAFEQCDVIVTPTAPTPAFRFGENSDPLQMYLRDLYTIPANLAGLPGISVPCGMVDGLPVGIQFVGQPFDEKTLLQIAYAYEHQRGFDMPLPEVTL